MSDQNKRLEKQAQIARFIQHPKAEQISKTAFGEDAASNQLKLAKRGLDAIEWEDLFDPIQLENGQVTYLYDCSGFWKNWAKAYAEVDAATPLTADILLKKDSVTQKSPFDYAGDYGAAQELLSEDLWQHDPFSYEKIYFNLAGNLRPEATVFANVRQSIYRKAGKVLPEQKYSDKGLKLADIINDIRQGRIEQVIDNLDKAGITPGKELVLGPDVLGENVFQTKGHWDYFPQAMQYLAERGTELSYEDFLSEYRVGTSLLAKATMTDSLEFLFAPEVWVGRIDEMVKLSETLSQEQKDKIGFKGLVLEAAELSFENEIEINDSLTAKGLLEKKEIDIGDYILEMCPLAQDKIWENFDQVYEILEKKGEFIPLETLREQADRSGRTYLHLAARGGAFKTVMKMLEANGQALEAKDMFIADQNNVAVWHDAADQDQMRDILKPKYWVNRYGEAKSVYDNLNEMAQGSVHWMKFESQLSVLQLHKLKKQKGAMKVSLSKDEKPKDQSRSPRFSGPTPL